MGLGALQTWKCQAGWWAEEALAWTPVGCTITQVWGKRKFQSGKPPETQDAVFAWERAGSVGILGIEGHLDPLNLVAKLDGGAQLQLHALLHGGESQQQERLPVDVMLGERAG